MPAYTISIPDWHPTRLNDLLRAHWAKAQAMKNADAQMAAGYAITASVPKATGKRRVGLTITLAPRQRAGDPDAFWKSLCDALVAAGLLVDDNRQYVELAPVAFVRGKRMATQIRLEDIDEPT